MHAQENLVPKEGKIKESQGSTLYFIVGQSNIWLVASVFNN